MKTHDANEIIKEINDMQDIVNPPELSDEIKYCSQCGPEGKYWEPING